MSRPNGLHDLRADDDGAAAALDADEVAIDDAERPGQARMDLALRLRSTDRRARRCGASACPTEYCDTTRPVVSTIG